MNVKLVPFWRRILELLMPSTYAASKDDDKDSESSSEDHRGSSRVRVDMIRRMDAAPQRVNPSGWISDQEAQHRPQKNDEYELQSPGRYLAFADIDNPSLVENAIRAADKPHPEQPAGEAPDSAGVGDAQSIQSAQSNGREK